MRAIFTATLIGWGSSANNCHTTPHTGLVSTRPLSFLLAEVGWRQRWRAALSIALPPPCSPITWNKASSLPWFYWSCCVVPSGKWLLPICLTEHILWGCWESGIFPETSKVETSLPDPGLQDDVSGQIHSHLISGFVPLLPRLVRSPLGTWLCPPQWHRRSYILECSQADGTQMQAQEGLVSPHLSPWPWLCQRMEPDAFPLPAWSCREKARTHNMRVFSPSQGKPGQSSALMRANGEGRTRGGKPASHKQLLSSQKCALLASTFSNLEGKNGMECFQTQGSTCNYLHQVAPATS